MTDRDPIQVGDRRAKSWRVFIMPAIVLGFLGGHVIFVISAITIATGDPSFAVVPDYYQKSVDWDAHKAALADSESLGWQVELQPSEQVDQLGQREVVVVLRDRAGKPVVDATVTMELFHRARAGDVIRSQFAEVLPGQYAALLKMPREGRWEFDLHAEQGGQVFIWNAQRDIRRAEPAHGGAL